MEQTITLGTAYGIQLKLNELANIDYHDESILRRIISAIIEEVGEANHELKPQWAWWIKPREVDLAKAQEEITDVLFFVLTLAGFLEANDAAENFQEILNNYSVHCRGELKIHMDELMTTLGKEDSAFLATTEFLKELCNGEVGSETIGVLLSMLQTLAYSVGMDHDQLMQSYLDKVVVNIDRWLDNDITPEELRFSAAELKDLITTENYASLEIYVEVKSSTPTPETVIDPTAEGQTSDSN